MAANNSAGIVGQSLEWLNYNHIMKGHDKHIIFIFHFLSVDFVVWLRNLGRKLWCAFWYLPRKW